MLLIITIIDTLITQTCELKKKMLLYNGKWGTKGHEYEAHMYVRVHIQLYGYEYRHNFQSKYRRKKYETRWI